jgi:hypothetical protein
MNCLSAIKVCHFERVFVLAFTVFHDTGGYSSLIDQERNMTTFLTILWKFSYLHAYMVHTWCPIVHKFLNDILSY